MGTNRLSNQKVVRVGSGGASSQNWGGGGGGGGANGGKADILGGKRITFYFFHKHHMLLPVSFSYVLHSGQISPHALFAAASFFGFVTFLKSKSKLENRNEISCSDLANHLRK